MTCPRCNSGSFGRVNGASGAPVTRGGIVFRQHQCLGPDCGHRFLSAQLVVDDELRAPEMLATVLKQVLDERDAAIEPIEAGTEAHSDGHRDFLAVQP